MDAMQLMLLIPCAQHSFRIGFECSEAVFDLAGAEAFVQSPHDSEELSVDLIILVHWELGDSQSNSADEERIGGVNISDVLFKRHSARSHIERIGDIKLCEMDEMIQHEIDYEQTGEAAALHGNLSEGTTQLGEVTQTTEEEQKWIDS